MFAGCRSSREREHFCMNSIWTLERPTRLRQAALSMALSPAGILYVGSRAGKVYAMSLQTPDAPIHVVASGLQLPVGVAWREMGVG